MRHWLMKSEPDEMSIDALAKLPRKTAAWTGVRNYTARNFMRDAMKVGDLAFFYHSSCPEPGVAGIVRVSSTAHPDETQFDPKSDYFDPKATRETPRWMCVDVTFVEKTRLVSIAEMRAREGARRHADAPARQPAVDHAGDRQPSGRSSRSSRARRRRSDPGSGFGPTLDAASATAALRPGDRGFGPTGARSG